ncbi:MAG: response regulator [Deltaproteobacteria bacterium]|nr:response regulator [Deltaproteobacteria bacterium]
MSGKVAGKKILVVDDEPDVCEMAQEVLEGNTVEVAHSFEAAQDKLAAGGWDVVILDIMGVRGHDLLQDHGKSYPTIMLTAHALNVDAFKTSVAGKARLFLPKEELSRLEEYVERVLAEPKKNLWGWLLGKLDFRKWFGAEFTDADLGLSNEDVMEDLRSGRD